jgi:hypothetical protein
VLVAGVELPAVFDDGAADGGREVVDLRAGLGLRGVEEEGARGEGRAAEAVADVAVVVVGARRRDGVHDEAGRVAELGREAVGDELHLADEDFRDRHEADAGAVGLRVVVAVELVVRAAGVAVGVDARHAELDVGAARDVGLKQREVVGVARDERKVLDLVLVHHAPQIDLAGVGDGNVGVDGDRLLDAARFEFDGDRGRLPRRQRDALAHEPLEAGRLDLDAVGAQGEEREAVDAVLAGRHRPHDAGLKVGRGDAGRGDDGALRVSDGAFNLAVERLRLRGGRRRRACEGEGEAGDERERGGP